MLDGVMTANREPVFEVEVEGPNARQIVSFVLDTGFNGEATLSQQTIHDLGLEFLGDVRVELADGSIIEAPAFEGTILWHSEPRVVCIEQAETDPLLGMQLCEQTEIVLVVTDGGLCRITPLP